MKWHPKWDRWIVENYMVGKRLGFDTKESAKRWAERSGIVLIEVTPDFAPYVMSDATARRRAKRMQRALGIGEGEPCA